MTDPHRSIASPLSWIYWLLVVYASLHPFVGWSVPPLPLTDLLHLPRARSNHFDRYINIAGYVPLGFLFCVALAHQGWRRVSACLVALGGGVLTSYLMEVTQSFLPARVPSLLDWINNSLGTGLGVILAVAADAMGVFGFLQRVRHRWLLPHPRFGLILLLLWPIGLLFPPTVPWVEGQLVPRLLAYVQDNFSGTLAQQWLPDAVWREDLASDPGPSALSMLLLMSLGLLAPTSLAYCVCRAGWPRLVLMLICMGSSVVIITLSTGLNFGPDHAWAWFTPVVVPAFLLAGTVAVTWAWLPRRLIAAMGLMALSCLTTWINSMGASDPFYALSLQSWEQGTFIRFFGLAQWVGWLWPYAAILWLLSRVAQRDAA